MKDNALIKRCQKGEKQAFDELIRLYYPYVSGFLIKTTKDEILAEDLTQDVFLKMIQNIEKFNLSGNANLGTWLITIAKNCYIDHLRRNRIYLENIDEVPIADNRSLSDDIDQKLQYEELLNAIDNLPPEQGIAIRLKYEEDLTLAEIAKRFGVQSKTIKSRISPRLFPVIRKGTRYHLRVHVAACPCSRRHSEFRKSFLISFAFLNERNRFKPVPSCWGC